VSHIPSIDYSCARCGARTIYQLVPAQERPYEAQVTSAPDQIPSLDFSCSRCGASRTYTLVPADATTP
jgi:DNA-directed RNA polymerase subunit RPC12/RpoP